MNKKGTIKKNFYGDITRLVEPGVVRNNNDNGLELLKRQHAEEMNRQQTETNKISVKYQQEIANLKLQIESLKENQNAELQNANPLETAEYLARIDELTAKINELQDRENEAYRVSRELEDKLRMQSEETKRFSQGKILAEDNLRKLQMKFDVEKKDSDKRIIQHFQEVDTLKYQLVQAQESRNDRQTSEIEAELNKKFDEAIQRNREQFDFKLANLNLDKASELNAINIQLLEKEVAFNNALKEVERVNILLGKSQFSMEEFQKRHNEALKTDGEKIKQFNELQAINNDLNEQVDILKNQVNALTTDYTLQLSVNEQFKIESTNAQFEIAELKNKVTQVLEQKHQLEQTYEASQRNKGAIEVKEEELLNLRRQIADLQQRSIIVQNENNDFYNNANTIFTKNKEDLIRITNEKTTLLDDYNRIKQQLDEKEWIVNDLTRANEFLNTHIARINEQTQLSNDQKNYLQHQAIELEETKNNCLQNLKIKENILNTDGQNNNLGPDLQHLIKQSGDIIQESFHRIENITPINMKDQSFDGISNQMKIMKDQISLTTENSLAQVESKREFYVDVKTDREILVEINVAVNRIYIPRFEELFKKKNQFRSQAQTLAVDYEFVRFRNSDIVVAAKNQKKITSTPQLIKHINNIMVMVQKNMDTTGMRQTNLQTYGLTQFLGFTLINVFRQIRVNEMFYSIIGFEYENTFHAEMKKVNESFTIAKADIIEGFGRLFKLLSYSNHNVDINAEWVKLMQQHDFFNKIENFEATTAYDTIQPISIAYKKFSNNILHRFLLMPLELAFLCISPAYNTAYDVYDIKSISKLITAPIAWLLFYNYEWSYDDYVVDSFNTTIKFRKNKTIKTSKILNLYHSPMPNLNFDLTEGNSTIFKNIGYSIKYFCKMFFKYIRNRDEDTQLDFTFSPTKIYSCDKAFWNMYSVNKANVYGFSWFDTPYGEVNFEIDEKINEAYFRQNPVSDSMFYILCLMTNIFVYITVLAESHLFPLHSFPSIELETQMAGVYTSSNPDWGSFVIGVLTALKKIVYVTRFFNYFESPNPNDGGSISPYLIAYLTKDLFVAKKEKIADITDTYSLYFMPVKKYNLPHIMTEIEKNYKQGNYEAYKINMCEDLLAQYIESDLLGFDIKKIRKEVFFNVIDGIKLASALTLAGNDVAKIKSMIYKINTYSADIFKLTKPLLNELGEEVNTPLLILPPTQTLYLFPDLFTFRGDYAKTQLFCIDMAFKCFKTSLLIGMNYQFEHYIEKDFFQANNLMNYIDY